MARRCADNFLMVRRRQQSGDTESLVIPCVPPLAQNAARGRARSVGMVLARLLAAFAGPAPPPVPEPLIDVFKYHLRSMPLAGAVVYLAVILALHRLMRWREQPLSIPRSVLVMYNLVQVAINAYVAYAIAHAVGGWVFGLGVRDTPAVRHGVYLHYLCKVRTRTPPRPTAPAVSLSRQPLASHTSPSRLPPVLTLGSAAPPYSCQLSRHPAPPPAPPLTRSLSPPSYPTSTSTCWTR